MRTCGALEVAELVARLPDPAPPSRRAQVRVGGVLHLADHLVVADVHAWPVGAGPRHQELRRLVRVRCIRVTTLRRHVVDHGADITHRRGRGARRTGVLKPTVVCIVLDNSVEGRGEGLEEIPNLCSHPKQSVKST